MKHILITGSNGFIGSVLTSRLIRLGCKIYEFNRSDGDISGRDVIEKYKDIQLDYVFHLAAKTFVPDSWTSPLDFYQVNVMGTENILELCRIKNLPLTFMSSYLYGKPGNLPITEDHPVAPNNPYAHSKFLAEQLCRFYSGEFGVKIIVLRPFNAYGIGQKEKFLIPFVIRQALHDEAIKVKDLSPKRDFIYLEDLVDVMILSMKSDRQFATYNIGSGYSVSVKEVIDIIQDVLRTDKPVLNQCKVRANEIDDVIADITRASLDFGWTPRRSLEVGIAEIIRHEMDKLN